MRRSLFIALLSIGILFFSSCDTTNEPPTLPVAFKTEPSDEMRIMIEETPSDFTWEFFKQNILISLQSEVDWEGEIVLPGFQILSGEAADRVSTTPLPTNAEQLENGLSTGDLTLPEFIITDWAVNVKRKSLTKSFKEKWGDKEVQSSINLWEPEKKWSPSEIEEAILSEVDLGESETLFVVYAQLAEESPEREQTTQPFGILMSEE